MVMRSSVASTLKIPRTTFSLHPAGSVICRLPFGPGIRDDSGIELNSEVSIYYDPLISKLAAWGRTREESIDRLRRALDEYEVGGIKTTLPFFREIVRDEEFKAARLDTGFISRFNERRHKQLMTNEPDQTQEDIALIAASIHHVIAKRRSQTLAVRRRAESLEDVRT